ncbi:hypothetical protein ACTG9Q_31695 [Actinokineospora sp. 24-640]
MVHPLKRQARLRLRRSTGVRSNKSTANTIADARWSVVFTSILSLVSALAGAVVGGLIAAGSNEDIKAVEMVEQRAEQARQVRSGVYEGYLTSADQANRLGEQLSRCYLNAPDPTAAQRRDNPICERERNAANLALEELHRKTNPLQVYGTSEALNIAWEIIHGLGTYWPQFNKWTSSAPAAAGANLYYGRLAGEFRTQMCRDVSPIPREDC